MKKEVNTGRFQYSKVLVFATGIFFVATLLFCLTRDFSNIYDASMYGIAITITGGVFGSAIVWYEKKSQAENVSKMKLQHVKDLAEIEFKIYEKRLRLQKELGVIGQPGVDDMPEFHIDDQRNVAIDRDTEFLEERLEDSTSDPEMQSYG